MFDYILNAIQAIGRFSEHEKSLFIGKLQSQNFPKNAVLLKEGQICSNISFINEGAIRHFHITGNGDDLTLNLYATGDWVIDFDSFINQKPAKNTLIAVEKTEVLTLSVHDLHELIAHSQVFLMLGKLLYSVKKDALYDTLATPEEKYRHLLKTHPQLLQKFPLKQVASYLKMTPETLSRVRRKINLP